MIIIHIESGLGNQMLSYCEYLAIKKINPKEDIYIETIVYDIPECNEVINQWNGYELERIFGIRATNLKDVVSKEQWNIIMNSIKKSKFWDKNWNWPIYFTQAFNLAGLNVKNIRGNFEAPNATRNVNMKISPKLSLRQKMASSRLGDSLKRIYYFMFKEKIVKRFDKNDLLFFKTDNNILSGQFLAFKFKINNISTLTKEIEQSFIFPEFTNTKDIEMINLLTRCNSVAIHARRGDMLNGLKFCYEYGYFKRAVKYIKSRIDNPVFIFFTNTGSIEWCKNNGKIFGLDYKKDNVFFVDWHCDEESYRDMQLMSYCKHAIITISSFGWWGAYFIKNKNKITISPIQQIAINTTFHI
jgi:hypothetical protein